jgi:hypothetical protein
MREVKGRESDPVAEFAGALTGTYEPGELARMRDEWDDSAGAIEVAAAQRDVPWDEVIRKTRAARASKDQNIR